MPVYNKLVRDRIPEIISESGKECTCTTLEQEAYIDELKKKLEEETEEYLQASNDTDALEELADILELLHTLAAVHNASPEELENVRAKKAEKRGGFQDRIFLIETTD